MIEGADLVGSGADQRVGRSAALRILRRGRRSGRLGSCSGAMVRPAGLDRLGAGPKGPDRPRPAVAGRFRAPDHPATRTASAFPSLGLVSLK